MAALTRARLGAAWGACALALACAGAPTTPSQTVDRFLHALARDPLRSLPLLAPGFHAAHGLRYREVADPPVFEDGMAPPTASWTVAPDVPEAPVDAAAQLERARVAWLTVLAKRAFALQGPALDVRHRSETVLGNRAEVVIGVRLGASPPARVTYGLVRASDRDPWRIASAEATDVVPSNLVAAFIAAPNAERYRAIQGLLSRRGDPRAEPPRAGSR